MRSQLEAAFSALEEDLPRLLISAEQRQNLRRLSATVPAVWHTFGFECRLGGRGGAVDLGVSIVPGSGGRDALAEAHEPLLARAVASDDRWARLRDFARRWRDPGSLLAEWVPFLFLEYDADSTRDDVPVPSIFVALDTPSEPRPDRPHVAAAALAASLLRGGALSRELGEGLLSAFELLPPPAVVLHLGLMLGRADAGLRLSVLLPSSCVQPYLRALGGAEAAHGAASVLSALPSWLAQSQVDFDLTPEPRARIGFTTRPRQSGGRRDWKALLGDLTSLGLCEPHEAATLLEWPACSGGLLREISHVKLVCDPARPIEAKAYFGARLTH